MHVPVPRVKRLYDQLMDPIGHVFHIVLGLSPNQISCVGFFIGIVSVILVLLGHWQSGLVVMGISLFLDGIDGNVARRFNLQSDLGKKLEILFDRSLEAGIIFALSITMDISIILSVLLIYSILLMTSLRERTRFDPGMKRIALLFGFIINFEFIFHMIFLTHIGSFIFQMVILDYKSTGGSYTC